MALRGWSWDAAVGSAGLGDRPLLEALHAALPDEVVEAAIDATGTREQGRRRLPTRLVVALVVAMGLWATESVRHALAGAFLYGVRLMAVDGTTVEVAETPTNPRAFGRPRSRRGVSGFAQVRVVALIEPGTHALCDVVLRPCRAAETPAGRRLLRSIGPGMLLLWDRDFDSFEMIRATQARGADYLGRAKTNLIFEPTEVLADGSFLAAVYPTPYDRLRRLGGIPVRVIEYALDTPAGPGHERYRLSTSLLDERTFPAEQLARADHERWAVGTALDELKVHPWAHPRPLRSQHPREVVQELYGLLLAHLAIRTLMHQAAQRAHLDPDCLSFTGALHVLRRAIPRPQRTQPDRFPFFATGS